MIGVLTAKLTQPFLKCFKDDHVSVRDHACRTTYKLQLRDETIRNLLIECIEFDAVEKVRYSAIEGRPMFFENLGSLFFVFVYFSTWFIWNDK